MECIASIDLCNGDQLKGLLEGLEPKTCQINLRLLFYEGVAQVARKKLRKSERYLNAAALRKYRTTPINEHTANRCQPLIKENLHNQL